ncbi:hypothetical protein LINPERHAP1_LOCUS508, partial [Linum perenne]
MRRLDWSLTEIAPTEAGRRSRYAWNVPLTTTLRGGAEEERLRMMAVLEGVAPGWISQGPPAPRWSFSTSGRFTVSSFSRILSQGADGGFDDFPTEVIWVGDVPTKVAGFLWQVFYKSISTFENLQKRGFIG